MSLASNIIEDIFTCYQNQQESFTKLGRNIIKIFPQKKGKIIEKEEKVLKERILRFHLEKLKVVISELSCEEDILENMSENVNEENGTSYMMKESTKYDLAVSDQTSVFSRKINQNKPGYEESIDLTCLEISDLSCKIDLCPQNNKEGDQTLSEIFSYFSIPEITSKLKSLNLIIF